MLKRARTQRGLVFAGLLSLGLGWAALCGSSYFASVGSAKDAPAADDAALLRTRKQVRMLDDLYKTAVVLITDKYVHTADDFPAGSAAVALFAAMKKKGWHEVRLVDVAGEPIMEKNAPRDDFEKAAAAALKAGKDWHETIVTENGQRKLLAATPIPVVSQKCTLCHENYKKVKEGQPIGLLSYRLTIE